MDDGEVFNEEYLEHDLSPFDAAGDLRRGEEELSDYEPDFHEEEDVIGGKEPSQLVFSSYSVKIIEILKNLHSPEIKIYSDASKEFIGLLKGETGGGILCEYIQLAPKCSEIVEAWRLHQGKPGMAHILSLVSVILDHPDGKSRGDGISRHLDHFARMIVATKLDDIYTELNSQESRRQSVALNLLASVVRRGGGFATEVAKNLDFKLPVLSRLSGIQKKKGREERYGSRQSTRRAFVGFAMSFLEVGNPRQLRWVLQQRELYSGVLRGLRSDDIETVIYVLSVLRDKVLVEDSFVPPALRSVLFGSITLEQLSYISGNPMAGHGADIAHEVLVMVCTNPSNGLMPGLKIKGNEKRLFELMRKLKATEVGYHRELLLAMVKKRPSLSAAYMDEFPYHLEPRSSSSWFTAISLAADVISSVNTEAVMSFAYGPEHLAATDSDALQSIFKSIIPNACSRSLVNKGLLHADILVKHGSLRLILESLKSLGSLIMRIDDATKSNPSRKKVDSFSKGIAKLHGLPGIDCFVRVDNFIGDGGIKHADNVGTEKWVSLRQFIQDEARGALPDPQVLLKLLSSLSFRHSAKRLKRTAIMPEVAGKRLKSDVTMENVDIIISGVDMDPTNIPPSYQNEARDAVNISELDGHEDRRTIVAEIWGLNKQKMVPTEPLDEQDFFYSRLLDVLSLYMRILPSAFDGSFDFFKILPTNALCLPTDQQQSLLSLLVEHIGQSPGSSASARVPDFMYKYLQPLTNLLIFSPCKRIRDQAYILAKASLISTGAFDQNLSEIDAWLISIPGYSRTIYSMESQGAEAFHCLYAVVISFLCDAVSTVGNNLYKHLAHMHKLISNLENFQDVSPGFSPLVVCVLQKCLRLLESDSGTFKLYKRSAISLYVSNALNLILQSQVDMKILPGLIDLILNEKFVDDSKNSLCEWRPLKNLLHFVQNLLNQQRFTLVPMMERISDGHNSFESIYSKIKEFIGGANSGKQDEVAFAFLSSIICAPFEDVLRNLHFLLAIALLHFSSYDQFFSYVLFLEPKFLAEVVDLWPDMFLSCLEKIKDTVRNDCRHNNDHSLGRIDYVQSSGTSLFSDNLVSEESAATAFSLFFRNAPFYALFSAFVCFGSYGCRSSRILDILSSPSIIVLLKVKLAEGSTDDLVLHLRCILFWAYQIRSSYRAESSDALEELFQMSFTLVDCIIEHVLVDSAGQTENESVERSLSPKYIQDVIELILHHPLVALFVSYPICGSRNLANDKLHDSTDFLLTYSKQNFHKMDYLVLQLLTKVFENLYRASWNCPSQMHVFDGSVLKASRHLVQKIALLFRENFDICVERRDLSALLPSFYIYHSMMRFSSPFDLLELAHWMFCEVEINISGCSSPLLSAVPFCLSIADGALDLLYGFLKQSNCTSEPFQFYGTDDKSFNAAILQKVYYSILDLAVCSDIESANICLLKAVNFVYHQRSLKPDPTSLPLYMLFSRMVTHSPMKLLLHCVSPTCRIKATLLSLLMEISPLHMGLFGQMFLCILNKDSSVLDVLNMDGAWPLKDKLTDRNCNYCLSEDDFVLLLPASLSYITSYRKDLKLIGNIPIFYSKFLLENLSNWKSYVSRSVFQEEYPEHAVTSSEDFHDCFNSSLLGKAVTMLHYFFILNGSSVTKKQRLKIFDSVYLHSFELLDHDLKELNACSYQKSLKLIIEVYAKISFTRLLLSPVESLTQLDPETGESYERTHKKESRRLNCAKLRFITILVNSFDNIVRIFSLKNGSSSKSFTSGRYNICRFLEHYILKNIIELSIESKGYLGQLPSIPFLDHFIRSCLLHRFEDPSTLKAIRCFLAALSERAFLSSEILGLLLGHSQFVSTILSSDSFSDSSALAANDSLLQPLPSVFKSLDISYSDRKAHEFRGTKNSGLEERRLELIKLLRVLYYYKSRENNVEPENIDGKDSRELLILLLSAYGATMSETDLEIFHLMHEIQSREGSEHDNIAEMDYLWGKSALKIKKEVSLYRQSSSSLTSDCESAEDLHKMLFRENIPVDTKQCLLTVLHFCYDRSSLTASMSLENLLQDKFVDTIEQSSKGDLFLGYDPIFILRFSLHGLVMGFIEPVEFSQLGLLAIAFVSISSLDEELRKLGYEVLGSFKLALENCRRNKDLLQLQLLLTYFQNGITEPWEKVPSVFAIFAAEASFILLDPRQNHFFTISKLLMQSPNVNFKSVPLFHTFFGSTSIHFKMERMWILQLLYAGINLDDDAKIYRRNKLLESLLTFHASSISDSQSSFLILQVLRRSVKLPILADYLVKECGLLSWLSSVLSYFGNRLGGDQKRFSLRAMELVLKVVSYVVSVRSVFEWLQECALEQISELSTHLHVLLMNDLKLLKENVSVVNLILHVMISTTRLSHERTIYQPHFTISLEGLFQLYRSFNAEFINMDYAVANELVTAILMSTPMPIISNMDKARLVELLRWAISASLQSVSQKRLFKESYPLLLLAHKEEQEENESLISKLLRWTTASVILGNISNKAFNIKTEFSLKRSSFKSLQSLLEFITKEEGNFGEENFSANEAIAFMILYLQQLLRRSSINLPSVIFALCSLLLSDGVNTTGKDYLDENHVQITLLCSKIRCPIEVNPSWRWSFDHPWRDDSLEQTEIEQMEEAQACQSLLVIFSTALGGKQSGLPVLSYLDLECSRLFDWERDILLRKQD